jgi:anaerobic magnesium-protoporphyrin IX monomethyl ester cyclase
MEGTPVEKLLLLVPPNITEAEFLAPAPTAKISVQASGRAVGSVITDMPLGVISISAYLKRKLEIDIRVVDFNVELNRSADFTHASLVDYFRDHLERLPGDAPTVVGVSALFSTAYRSLIELGKLCRQLYPRAFIIAGGNVPTVSYRQIFGETDAFDAICYGEGELPTCELLTAPDKQLHASTDPAWITRPKALALQQPAHRFIEDLDEIPFDDSVVDPDDYAINPTIAYYASYAARGKSFNVMTSRGCPFRCTFCASHKTHGRSMRYHSLARVKADITRLRERGVNTVTIEDDHFMGDKRRAFEIVKAIADLGMTAFFPNSLALYALDYPMLRELKRAGVEQLVLAVESGSERVLREIMHKPLKLEITRRVADDCRALGIYTDCNILLGLPGETKADIEDTRAFLKTVDANWFRINVATPLLGSEMYDICEAREYFKGAAIEANYKKAVIETEEFTAEFIQKTTYDLNIELNFVHNADMRRGDYETALRGFDNVLKAKPDHAIGMYYKAICLGRVGETAAAGALHERARQTAAGSEFWLRYVQQFDIPLFDDLPIRAAC